ncbi:MAG: metallophosphoesterase [Actinomycetota bacterium]|nr:metallophosphatase family protein [Actinomycetota bacterium]
MRDSLFAVFSDMHGNAVALDAVVEDIARLEIENVICLGDAVQGGSEPERVVEILKKIGCPVVMGNSDDWVLHGKTVEQVNPAAEQIRDWTRERLGAEGLAYIGSFTPTVEVDLGYGRRFLGFHGSPRSYDEVLLPETSRAEVDDALAGHDQDVLAGGHVHLQWTRTLGNSIFFNPGSAGVAYNRHMDPDNFYIYPLADYAVIHSTEEGSSVEFRQIPFNVDLLEEAATKSGRPYSEREGAMYRPKPN